MDYDNITETDYINAQESLSNLKEELRQVIFDKECNKRNEKLYSELYNKQKLLRQKIAKTMLIIRSYESKESERKL